MYIYIVTRSYFWLRRYLGSPTTGLSNTVSPALITWKAGTSWPAARFFFSQHPAFFSHHLLYDTCFCFLLILWSLFIFLFSVVSRVLPFFFYVFRCLIHYFPLLNSTYIFFIFVVTSIFSFPHFYIYLFAIRYISHSALRKVITMPAVCVNPELILSLSSSSPWDFSSLRTPCT